MTLNINDALDVDFTGKSTTVRSILQYDASIDKFILTTIPVQKTFLTQSVDDLDLPDQFIRQLEDEIDPVQTQFLNTDAGTF